MNCLLFALYTPLMVVETWLSSDISDSELSLPNFQSFRLDRSRHGGGILVYVKSSLSASVIPTSSPIELLLSLTFKHVPVSLATFYRPPSCPNDLSSLHTVLSSLAHSYTRNLILVGDFNVNYLSSSSLLNQLHAISDLFSLDQIVTQPTHFSPSGTPSLIDLVFVPSSLPSHSCNVLPPISNSDHNSILCSLSLSTSSPSSSPSPSSPRRVWLYNHADILLINRFLSSIPWTSILSTSDVNHAWLVFKHTFLKVMHLTIPSKIASPPPQPPWISKSLLSSFKYRNFFYKRAKFTNSVHDWSLYRSFRNSTLSLLRSLKFNFFHSLSSSPSPRHFWSSVKKLRKKTTSIPLLSHNNSIIHSDLSKASLLNDFFSTCFNSSTPPLTPIPTSHSPPSSPSPPDFLCTEDEILHLLLNLPSDTATGPDGISARMLKLSASSIAPSLTLIFNLSISSSIFPSDWKNSNIVPIPKSSSPSSSPSDYRPISLLPIISKVLERHIFNYLYHFCTVNQILSDSQFGFRPGRSTESALLSITHSWLSSLDSHNSLCAAFFDLRKAFDSVPHLPLMHTLSSIGLSSHLTSWIHSYLCHRSQQVVLNGFSSHKTHAFSGVPQGSILGPLLFYYLH